MSSICNLERLNIIPLEYYIIVLIFIAVWIVYFLANLSLDEY